MLVLPLNKTITFLPRTLILLSVLLIIGCAQAKQPLQLTKDIRYNNQDQQLDLYMPATRNKNTAIMFIHGGGFKAGDKSEMTTHAKHFATQGFVTTSVNYRLSLDYAYPAAINDVTDALNWMKEKANAYGYNPDQIVLVGYSAGGTLALNVGLNHANKVVAVVSVAGISDISALIENATIPELKTDINKYMDGKDPALASPISQANEQSPPVLLFHGDSDGLIPISQSIALADKLKQNNVPVTLNVFHGAGHEIMLPNKHLAELLNVLTDFILTIEVQHN